MIKTPPEGKGDITVKGGQGGGKVSKGSAATVGRDFQVTYGKIRSILIRGRAYKFLYVEVRETSLPRERILARNGGEHYVVKEKRLTLRTEGHVKDRGGMLSQKRD